MTTTIKPEPKPEQPAEAKPAPSFWQMAIRGDLPAPSTEPFDAERAARFMQLFAPPAPAPEPSQPEPNAARVEQAALAAMLLGLERPALLTLQQVIAAALLVRAEKAEPPVAATLPEPKAPVGTGNGHTAPGGSRRAHQRRVRRKTRAALNRLN